MSVELSMKVRHPLNSTVLTDMKTLYTKLHIYCMISRNNI